MALRIRARLLAVSASLVLGAFAAGCSGDAPSANEDISLADEAVTDVNHSSVKRQSIGNCWIYATIGWAESLNKSATGVEQNYSESYVTFWSWFDRLTTGEVTGTELATGGSFGYGTTLLGKFGQPQAATLPAAGPLTTSREARDRGEELLQRARLPIIV
jgi:hypothetical protein